MYTWEIPFSKLVQTARNVELEQITLANHFRICSSIIKIYVPKISVLLCILGAYFRRLSITSQYVFSLTNLYENLKFTAIVRMPVAFFRYSEAKISIQRIQDFLLSEHCDVDKNIFKSTVNMSGVFLQNVSVKWDQSSSSNTLTNVTFCAEPGELVCVIGSPGSGKSTLLQVVLNELPLTEGTVEVGGRVSYYSQEPWLFSGTIRENILFGLEMEQEKYAQVIKMTALDHDLLQLPYGDNSLVGERGVMLSGGQKARINLARAVYGEADVYLLDDPLSAVDVHVGRQIFNECIHKYLKNKCVVLVTHQVKLLHSVDKVYLLDSGKVTKVMRPQEMTTIQSYPFENNQRTEIAPKQSLRSTDEEIVEKRASTSDYANYLLAGRSWILIITLLLLLIYNQSLGYGIDYFITFWVNNSQKLDNTQKRFFMTKQSLYIYVFLILFLTIATHTGAWFFVKFCRNISENFHERMFFKVLWSPIRFFQHNSAGGIMHRFSKDIGHVDEYIPGCLHEVITQILMVLGLTTVICVLNHRLIIPSIILYIVFYYCAIIFQPSNISIRRIEANGKFLLENFCLDSNILARNPIFSHLTSTIQGLTIIKALGAPKVLQKEFNKRQDYHTSSYYLFRSLFFSLGFWTDVLLLFYTGAVTFSFFFITETNVGDVGLAVTLSTILGGMIQLGMKSWGELDSYISSVERIVEYTNLPQEPSNHFFVPPTTWPERGHISFCDVSMRYSPNNPLILKNISFEIQHGEKIGILGRTGAGKTSLTSALFRLFDFDGSILIDNVDTKSIALTTLRSKLAIIPQEPVLFLGRLRKNLDPFDQFTDLQLWQALEEVQLKEFVTSKPLGLDSKVSEGGLNFSVGQKQLLCLARTLLRDAKIIVLDEATASVDVNTDEIIQNIIRRRFQNCTVLTIAHRLNTVRDSDKILVIENGRVAEFGSPEDLMKNSAGFFYRYVHRN
ncbi:hypothetical protein Zmor_002105 [Zophobas morio]|uniref:Multidrug resistance-associated protein lethal(2)03659 n=1 Tax=Zophobas morio TaxID=2755281 RepID=A0AA38J6W5_9CUCU|nr:hypothetical protein Zmor_002105 [Zophobas morio]